MYVSVYLKWCLDLSPDFALEVELRNQLLDFRLTIPSKFQGTGYSSSGLLGNNDGDSTNDFILPNGTTLSDAMTDKEIFSYGQQCKYHFN